MAECIHFLHTPPGQQSPTNILAAFAFFFVLLWDCCTATKFQNVCNDFDTNEQKIESSGGKVHVDLHYNFQATLFNRLTLKMRTLVKYWHVYA